MLHGESSASDTTNKTDQGQNGNSDSTRDYLSKQALRLRNFKKKIEQNKLFEIGSQHQSAKIAAKNDRLVPLDLPRRPIYSQRVLDGDALGAFTASTNNAPMGPARPVPTHDETDRLRQKFLDLKSTQRLDTSATRSEAERGKRGCQV